jgi:hypothetical protein
MAGGESGAVAQRERGAGLSRQTPCFAFAQEGDCTTREASPAINRIREVKRPSDFFGFRLVLVKSCTRWLQFLNRESTRMNANSRPCAVSEVLPLVLAQPG